MKQLYRLMRRDRILFFTWLLVMCLSIIFQIFATMLNADLLNAIIAMDVNHSFSIMGWIIFAWLVYLSCDYGKKRIQNILIGRLNSDLRNSFMDTICTFDYETFHKKEDGTYVSSFTNDINLIEQNGTRGLFSLVENMIMALFSFIALSIISIWLSAFSLFLFVLIYFLPKVFDQSIKKESVYFSLAQETYTKKIKNLLQGYDVFSDYGAKDQLKKRMNEHSENLERCRKKFYNLQDGVNVTISILNISVQLLNNCACIALIFMKEITAGSIMSVGNLSGKLFSSLSSLSEHRVKIASCIELLKKYKPQSQKGKKILPPFQKQLSLKDLTFTYDHCTPILDHINLTFEKNKKYAIIGKSGCGKSTLLRVLSGKLTEYQGLYMIDHQDVKEIMIDELRKQVAYIDQTAMIFDETIKENITLGKSYGNEEIKHAVSIAGLDDFIFEDQDLQKQMINHGDNLSGGQRQRIMIARAILANKKIYLIDEATSNLDRMKMEQVESYLLSNPDITLIYVSHHLSSSMKKRFDAVYTL